MEDTSQRAYLESHPWLSFELDTRRLPPEFWALTGAIEAKCSQLKGVPLKPMIEQFMRMAYFVKGAYSTIAIEGNTLTEQQVGQLARGGQLDLPLSREADKIEARNVIDQFNRIGVQLDADVSRKKLSPSLIVELHAGLLKDIEQLPGHAGPGEIRKYSVGVQGANYRGAPWEDCGFLLAKMCSWINKLSVGEDKTSKFATILLKAILSHLYLAWIHPFGDGNGRIARLVEFYILLNEGLPSLAVHLPSNHYQRTRPEYYRILDYTSKSKGDIVPFLIYALRGFNEGLDEQLETIRSQQVEIAWDDFVSKEFEGKGSATAVRRKLVVTHLSRREQPVRRKDIRMMSPAIATLYGGKTDKTISRDLNELIKMKLVRKIQGGYVANVEIILAFLS